MKCECGYQFDHWDIGDTEVRRDSDGKEGVFFFAFCPLCKKETQWYHWPGEDLHD